MEWNGYKLYTVTQNNNIRYNHTKYTGINSQHVIGSAVGLLNKWYR